MHPLSSSRGFCYRPFCDSGSDGVESLFVVVPIVYGGIVFGPCFNSCTSCPIQLCNHLAKDERVGCFTLVVFLHCVVGWFAVCKRGITWWYSFISMITLIFSYIRRLGSFYLGSKFWISIFFGVFRKINIFWGMKIMWIFFGVVTKLDYIWGSYLCILWSFLRSWHRMGIFLGLLKFQIFFRGAWISWYFWGVKGRCWARAYVCRKIESTPPPWGPRSESFTSGLLPDTCLWPGPPLLN